MLRGCYVKAVSQVSCQKPLSDRWMDSPEFFDEGYIRSQEPSVKEIIPPADARRMGKVLKRAIATSDAVLKEAQIGMPDAIITGTAMGCMENSEKFLEDLSHFGENCLKPSLFMQSTHNTISSLIGIFLKCHGYNNTYSHKGLSFESALLDAWIQIRGGEINNALVGAQDEVTPLMSEILRTTHPEYSFITETSVSAILSNSREGNLCEIDLIELLHEPTIDSLIELIKASSPDYLLLGLNGNKRNDDFYQDIISKLSPRISVLQYKNIFGDNFSSSAFGFYSGCRILEKQQLPEEMAYRSSMQPEHGIDKIIVLNHTEGKSWGLVSLKRV